MNSVAKKLNQEFFAINVFFTDEVIGIVLSDGREVRVPLDFYPRLKNASSTQQNNFEIIGLGTCIHWPDIDEDLSVEGIILGLKQFNIVFLKNYQ